MFDYDLIIVGGGPVGLSLAAAMARFAPGLRLALCDRRPPGVPKDARASAIAAGGSRLFEALGLWEGMAEQALAVKKMKLTDSGSGDRARPLFLKFEGDVLPGRPYAHMVPNPVIATHLLKALKGKVEWLAPVEIAGFSADGIRAELRFADGKKIAAPLVVAADGARSALRSMAGIVTFGHDYAQAGLVATIAHERDHEQCAFEHFRPAGPFASLPLPDRRSSLVWTESRGEALRLKTLPPEALAVEIEKAMGACLGDVTLEGPVQMFDLKLQIARSFVGQRLALIGDAAHVIHPIAGQGLNLGLRDVAALCEVLVSALRLGQDMGAADVLENYQRWRRFDSVLMAYMTDGLNRLFSNDVAPVRAVRDLGLGLVDRFDPLKSLLIRHAAGVGGGPAPKLLSGVPL